MKKNTEAVLRLLKKKAKKGRVTITYGEAIKTLKFTRKRKVVTYETDEYTPSRTLWMDEKKELVKLGLIKPDFTNRRKPTYIIKSSK